MTDIEIIEWVLLAKGGPGSGAQPGHEFNGNQWSGRQASDARGMAEDAEELAGRAENNSVTRAGLNDQRETHMALAGEHMQAGDDLDPNTPQAQAHYDAAQAHSLAADATQKAYVAMRNGDPDEAETAAAYRFSAANAASASRLAANSMR